MVKEFARAKINLTLDILGKRADGFHEVSMIMQTLELADIVELEKAGEITLKISGNDSLPVDEKNLAFRAVLEVQKFCGKNFGASINLTKKIPSAAGLAGGSSDAAAVIRSLNKLYDLNLSVEEMCEIGAKIGSDVPYCVIGGTCLATGRGEILTPLDDLKTFQVVLIKPRGEISTAWAYKTYDENPAQLHPPTSEIIKLLEEKNYDAAFKKFSNVLEPVAIQKIPAIQTYKKFLQDNGAKVAMMSGSGPTVFALTDKIFIQNILKNFNSDIDVKTPEEKNYDAAFKKFLQDNGATVFALADNFDAEKFNFDGAQIFITKTFGKVI